MSKKINYINRDFDGSRSDIITFIKEYYPEVLSDFNDASVGSVFIDMNAAVTDLLSHHTDRMFQETQLQYAQERSSVLNMAKTLGVRIPGNRPSVTVCDFSVRVPVSGDSYDKNYAPIIKSGAQASGNGFIFETDEDINFNEPFNQEGVANRLITPNFSSNNKIVSYTLTKRVVVKNGTSKIYKKEIGINETKSFYSFVLPEEDVLSIESIIVKEGKYSTAPSHNEFLDHNLKWYEMESLAESKTFIETGETVNGIKIGKWIETNNRFITEYTNKGYMKITFGGSTKKINELSITSTMLDGSKNIIDSVIDMVNNNSLGTSLKSGTTLFIKYKVGGGEKSNIPSNVINGLTNVNITVNGPNESYNADVRKSLTVNNPIPSFGGRSMPSIEEVKSLIKFNYKAQNRAVTLKDYHGLIGKMPGKYGAPYRYNVIEEKNKIVISVISKDSDGKLSSNIPTPLIDNITNYLSEYRMINDYVVVKSGKVFNIGANVDIMIEKNVSSTQIVSEVINVITNYFDPVNFDMGDDIYLSNLYEKINNVNGVLNVLNIEFENKFNGKYSSDLSYYAIERDDKYILEGTEMTLINEGNSIFEIKYPETDIIVRVK